MWAGAADSPARPPARDRHSPVVGPYAKRRETAHACGLRGGLAVEPCRLAAPVGLCRLAGRTGAHRGRAGTARPGRRAWHPSTPAAAAQRRGADDREQLRLPQAAEVLDRLPGRRFLPAPASARLLEEEPPDQVEVT